MIPSMCFSGMLASQLGRSCLRTVFFVPVALCLLLGHGASFAQEPAESSLDEGPDPVAMALFRDGRQLIRSGQFEEGCRKMGLSMQRYPDPATLLNLAQCREREKRTATAWAHFRRASGLLQGLPAGRRRDALQTLAREGEERLLAQLPLLSVDVHPHTAGVRVLEAGRELPIGEWVPLDPGEHRLTLRATGFQEVVQTVRLEPGKRTVATMSLVPVVAPRSRHNGARRSAHVSSGHAQTSILPWVLGAGGVLLVGASAGFAWDATAMKAKLSTHCGDDLVCNEDPAFDPEPTNARKNRSTAIAVGLGTAGLVSLGLVLSGTLKPSNSPTTLSVSGEGVVWRGAF